VCCPLAERRVMGGCMEWDKSHKEDSGEMGEKDLNCYRGMLIKRSVYFPLARRSHGALVGAMLGGKKAGYGQLAVWEKREIVKRNLNSAAEEGFGCGRWLDGKGDVRQL